MSFVSWYIENKCMYFRMFCFSKVHLSKRVNFWSTAPTRVGFQETRDAQLRFTAAVNAAVREHSFI